MRSRGIRNNSPGNIRKGDPWLGLSVIQSDPDFAQFDRPEYGIRALVRVLKNYERLHGLDTVYKMIGRWAPPIENDTESYVRHVERATGVGRHNVYPLDNTSAMVRLLKAIIVHENGTQPYSDAQLMAGILLEELI